ncbi:MAG: putative toxin-antitoxin system toxin component, PIN family [bacterium]|nr:putative toxin-antitoxin system toxin component, PIN family [bacterium]
MRAEARFAFDTNVLVSALLFKQGKPARALRRAQRRGTVLVSVPALEELSEVLQRRKLQRYLTAEEREEFLRALIAETTLVEPDLAIEACRDPKDDKFLELAVNGKARYLITGDQDLLVLNPFRDVAIVTPDQFLVLTDEED